jgi:hypothetical protein
MSSSRQKLAEVTKLVDEMRRGASDLPQPLARTVDEGLQMSRLIIGMHLPNITHLLMWVALGESGVSPHTRWNAANTMLSVYGLSEPKVPGPDNNTLPP